MENNLYQSKSRLKKATPFQKDISDKQRKINKLVKLLILHTDKIIRLKKQTKIDAKFKSLLKKFYPEFYKDIIIKFESEVEI